MVKLDKLFVKFPIMFNKPINLTFATSIHGKGGIATVLQVLDAALFFSTTKNKIICSHKNGNQFFGLSRFFSFATALVQLTYFCCFYKVGIVHVHMASRGSYSRKSIIIKLAKKLGAKVIIHLHGGEFNIFYSTESSISKQSQIRDSFNMADKIIVLSEQWLEWVNSIIDDQSKTVIVYNGVPKVVSNERVQDKSIIIFLGKLCKAKGVDDLIDAFQRLHLQFPNTELHLAGNGDVEHYRQKVSELALAKHIHFLGWISGKEKNECLANASIYCLPSYNEGFPMGVLEAMSSEVVVVASKVGGIPDAITDEQEGLLIDAGDVNGLTVALSKLLTDETLSSQLSKAAKAKYENNFTPEAIVPKLCGIYDELLEENK